MLQDNAFTALINMLRMSLLPPNSLYINRQQPHSLLCTCIIPPKDELQQQRRKFVNKQPRPEETLYLQKWRFVC